jgi:hypothetical protein
MTMIRAASLFMVTAVAGMAIILLEHRGAP